MSIATTPVDPSQKRNVQASVAPPQVIAQGAEEYAAIAQIALQALLAPAGGAERALSESADGRGLAQAFASSEPASARGDDRRSDPDLADDSRGSDYEYTQALANRSATDMSRVNAHELTTRGDRGANAESLADAPEDSGVAGRNAHAKGERASQRSAKDGTGTTRPASDSGVGDAPAGASAGASPHASALAGSQHLARADQVSPTRDRAQSAGGIAGIGSAAGSKRAGQASPIAGTQQGGPQGKALSGEQQGAPSAGLAGSQRAPRGDAFKKLLESGRPTQRGLEQQHLASQATKGLAFALKHGGGEATIRLSPDGLGALKINVKVEDAQVVATLAPTTESARQLLIDSTQTLREALEAQGLSVERIVIEDLPSEHGKHDAQAGNTPGQGTRGSQDAPAREPRDGGALAQQFGAPGEQGRSRDGEFGRDDSARFAQGRADASAEQEAPAAPWWNSTLAGTTSNGIEWIA